MPETGGTGQPTGGTSAIVPSRRSGSTLGPPIGLGLPNQGPGVSQQGAPGTPATPPGLGPGTSTSSAPSGPTPGGPSGAPSARLQQIFAGGGSIFPGAPGSVGVGAFPSFRLPSIQTAADKIRAAFQKALGSLDGFPFNPNLRSSFWTTGNVIVDGQAGSGLTVTVYLYQVSQLGAATRGPLLAQGTAIVDSSGVYRVQAKGVYDVTIANYTVEIDVSDGSGTFAVWKQIPISGSQLYFQGAGWNFVVATRFELTGTVTLDGVGRGGVGIDARLEQVFPDGTLGFELEGSTSSAQDGTYDLIVRGIYDAIGTDESAFNFAWTAYWGPVDPANLVEVVQGSINGGTLARGPQTFDVQLTVRNGQVVSTTGRKPPPPHHQRSP